MQFTKRHLKELKALHAYAIDQKEEVIQFHGRELNIDYAKYLIEYLEFHFNQKQSIK